MSFSKPLVLNYDGGTKSLELVNQDNYGTTYLLRESTQEFRMEIRHSRGNTNAVTRGKTDRHNVTLKQTVYGTGDEPDVVRQVSMTITNDYRDTAADVAKLSDAVVDLIDTTAATDLVGWLS